MTALHFTDKGAVDRDAYMIRTVRDCIKGAQHIKQNGKTYVPKGEAMQVQDFAAYVERGSWCGTPEATVRDLLGIALRQHPRVVVPELLKPMLAKATWDGDNFFQLIETTVKELLSVGRIGLWLDYATPEAAITDTPVVHVFMAEEIEAPDWTTGADGMRQITKVVLATDRVDVNQHQIKVKLYLDEEGVYTVDHFVEDLKTGDTRTTKTVQPTARGKTMGAIPFVLPHTGGLGPVPDVAPPLYPICDLAIARFRNSCDLEVALHMTCSPTAIVVGDGKNGQVNRTVGAGQVWELRDGSQAYFLEPGLHAINHVKTALDDKLDQMRMLGARLMTRGISRNESYETAAMNQRGHDSMLVIAIRSAEAALQRILEWANDWQGNTDPVKIELHKDFVAAMMTPQQIQAQFSLYQAGAISWETFYLNLQRGEIARPEVSADEERQAIADDGRPLTGIM